MKKHELKMLLRLFDSENFNGSEWQLFSHPEEARSKYAELRHLRENAGFRNERFKPFFSEMVMRRIFELTKAQTLDEVLARFMYRVMLAGSVTIVLVILLLFAYHGQVGVDALTGIDNDTQINFVTSLFNEY
jgi:hypothetical protein